MKNGLRRDFASLRKTFLRIAQFPSSKKLFLLIFKHLIFKYLTKISFSNQALTFKQNVYFYEKVDFQTR